MFARKLMTLLLFGLLSISTTAQSQTKKPFGIGQLELRGVAIDGDTLLITEVLGGNLTKNQRVEIVAGKTRIRLWGIDTPEMKDRAGWFARAALDDLLSKSEGRLLCTVVNLHEKRLVSLCTTNKTSAEPSGPADEDLGAALLAGGWAAAYRVFTYRRPALLNYATAYDRMEKEARTQSRGFWARASE